MNKVKNYCTIYLIRHGETDWNAAHLIQGQTDIPLNNEGELQAKEASEKLKSIHFDAVYSSDLVRAKRTAEIIVLERKLEIITTQLLREQHYGKFEGKSRQEFLQLFSKWTELSDEERHHYTVADEESNHQALTRLLTFLHEVSLAQVGKTILVATHGALMRYLLIHLGEATYTESKFVKNAGYIKLKSDGLEFFVEELNGIEKR